MAGFWIVILTLLFFGLVFWAAVGLLGGLVLALVYRSKHKRWQKIAAIVLGTIGVICSIILLTLMLIARAQP